MDKFRANDIINDMTYAEIDKLKEARDGYQYDDKDKATQKLIDLGFVEIRNFEYVHAKNSLRGITTTTDGDKILQEVDNRPVITIREQNLLDNGEIIKSTEVEVRDPQPAHNIPKAEVRPDIEKAEKVGEAEGTINAGDVGTGIEREKEDDQQEADKAAARGEKNPTKKLNK